MEIKKISLDPALSNIMQAFAAADLRHEVLITAMIDILTKKDKEGNSILKVEDIEAKAKEIQDKIVAESKIAKPSPKIIVPGQ